MQDRKIVHVYPPPDGSDATELLQRAIDEAGEHGTVHLHPGEYRTTSPLSRLLSRIRAWLTGDSNA